MISLSEALDESLKHLSRLGYPEAQLWRVEQGFALDRHARAVWMLRLCDPASKRDFIYNFQSIEEDQRVVVARTQIAEGCKPLTNFASPEDVLARNPRIWELVAEKQQTVKELQTRLEEEAGGGREQRESTRGAADVFQVIAGIGIQAFTGSSATYEHGRDAWVVTVEYPTEGDESGRVVSEDCSFWASLESGEPIASACPEETGEEEARRTETSAPLQLQQWRRYEDFEYGDALSPWQLATPGGCVPTSSEASQSLEGFLHQSARGGETDGTDCVSLTAKRELAVPPALVGTAQPVIAFAWRVPEFSPPQDPHGGKEGYADLVITALDDEDREVGRLRYRVSCDDLSGSGTP